MTNKPKKRAPATAGRPPGQGKDAKRGTAKEVCLQTAAELFLKKPLDYADPFGRLSKREVAREAGVWPNTVDNAFRHSAEWRDDVAAYLLGRTDMFREELELVSEAIAESVAMPVLDAIAHVAHTDLETLADNPAWNAMEVLATCIAPRSTKVAEIARTCYRDLDGATWTDIYGAVIERSGRVPRPPFTVETIGALLQALVEGCGIRHLFDAGTYLDPSRVGPRARYGGYAYAAAALLAVLTVDENDPDRRDVDGLLREMLVPADPPSC